MQFRHEQLPNGLDIIAEVSEAAHSASLGFFVKTGARDEHDSISGASHFLEHMVFKGTDTLSAEDINLRFDFMGASANAFTSEGVALSQAITKSKTYRSRSDCDG